MSVYIWKKESKERIILVVSLLFSCPVMADSVCVCVRRWQFFYFLFCKCVYFNWRLIIYNIVVVFAIYSHESAMSVHVSPILNSSHLLPHPITLGHPSASALSTLSHASNLSWRSVSHMIIYIFQCYSFKSSHPCLLPQSSKTGLYICVSFAVLHIGSLLHSF